MFADDTECFRQIANINDCMSLQNDLHDFYRWFKYWKVIFNSLKCKAISFTGNCNPIKLVYTINGELFENVSSFCD